MNKILTKIIILFLGIFAIFLICKQTDANNKHYLEVFYPKSNSVTIDAQSTFLIGHTNFGSILTINNETVDVLPNGSFATDVKLKEGENKFQLISNYNNEQKTLDYVVIKPPKKRAYPHLSLIINEKSLTPNQDMWLKEGDELVVEFDGSKWHKAEMSIQGKTIPMSEFWGHYTGRYKIAKEDKFDNLQVSVSLNSGNAQIVAKTKGLISTKTTQNGQIIKAEATIREKPDGTRLTPLPIGTKLTITGKINNCYRFSLNNKDAWVKCEDVKLEDKPFIDRLYNVKNISLKEDDKAIMLSLCLDEIIPFTINESDGSILLRLGDIASVPAINLPIVETNIDKNTLCLKITPQLKSLYGYDYFYNKNELILMIRKTPCIDENNPLNNKTIVIDPGHGGKELGAIGPTGIPEKEINLKIAQYLKPELEKHGAIVILTRDCDKQLDLNDRVKIAKEANADILLSVHNNAIPDGKSLKNEHGTSVYYYHPHAEMLAKSLHKTLLEDLKLKNYGIHKQSFVLTRPTTPIAVLVETAFMIYPYEYTLLITDTFQNKAAISIRRGLEDYFRQLK